MHHKYSAKTHQYIEQSHINFEQSRINIYFNATQSHPNILQLLMIIIKQIYTSDKKKTPF